MSFDKPRQIKYWQRCFKSVLPHHYTPNDSIRLTLGYFILAALDLLSSPSEPLVPLSDRPRLRAWVLSLKHREGGFCGSPNHVLPPFVTRGYEQEQTLAVYDDTENANIAATFSALLILGVLADDDADPADVFAGVNRLSTLRWLKKLQRPDGSFGEVVSADGTVSGGNDMRYCYMAATIRWILCGHEALTHSDKEVDFNVEGFVSHIRRSQSFDGGIADISMDESHAGYAFCAVAALAMLDLAEPKAKGGTYIKAGIPDPHALVHWLASRQFAYVDRPDLEDDEELPDISALSVTDRVSHLTGFNGRLNKVVDSCYTYWVSGTLVMLSGALSSPAPIDSVGARAFLLEKMQHKLLGGFGKHVERPPDVYHSYLALASLANIAGSDGKEEGEEEFEGFDVRLCLGRRAANRINHGRTAWSSGQGARDDA